MVVTKMVCSVCAVEMAIVVVGGTRMVFTFSPKLDSSHAGEKFQVP